jgi:hypothetical protein
MPGKFRVASFEVHTNMLRDDYSPFSGDLEASQEWWVSSLDEVEVIFSAMDVDSDLLTEPWKCDYPL